MKAHRPVLPFLIITMAASAFGQTAGVIEKSYHGGSDCKSISVQSADKIADGFLNMSMSDVNDAIAGITKSCGISEVTLRAKILAKIVRREPATDEIRIFYEEQYYVKTLGRIRESAYSDYWYRYASNDAWYSLVPLRHRVDSIMGNVAGELIQKRDLTADERLLCILFSGDDDTFEVEWNKAERNETYAGIYRKNEMREHARRNIALVFYSGVYSPIGSRHVIGTNPMFGVTFATPIENKVIVEFGMKIRVHANDQRFQYYAMGQMNEVNSDAGIFFGAIVGVKHFDNKKYIIQSRYGLGLESVDTGLSEPKPNSTNPNDPASREYYDLDTVHSSIGLAFLRSINNGRHIGIEVGLHACPYNLNRNLKTSFDSFAASGELFFRF